MAKWINCYLFSHLVFMVVNTQQVQRENLTGLEDLSGFYNQLIVDNMSNN
jgi:hypothetical protein